MALETSYVILSLIEGLGFLLNVLTLLLLSKLGLKDTDMWLGVTMALCDIILSGYKFIDFIITCFSGSVYGLKDIIPIIPLTGVVLFSLFSSVSCVGYLGLIRWLVICRGYRVNELKCWWWVYLGHMSISLILLINCSIKNGLVTFGKIFYPDINIHNTPALLFRLAIIITLIFCFTLFNVGYILIGKKYIEILSSRFNYQTRVEKQALKMNKIKIIIKITIMIIMYNIIIIPYFIVDFIELITGKYRDITSGTISARVILCIAFVNPIVLITMHCETWREAKKLFNRSQRKKHSLILDDHNISTNLPAFQA